MYETKRFKMFLEALEEDAYEMTEEDAKRDVEHIGKMIEDWGVERVLNAFKFALVGSGDEKAEEIAYMISELSKRPRGLKEKIMDFIVNL